MTGTRKRHVRALPADPVITLIFEYTVTELNTEAALEEIFRYFKKMVAHHRDMGMPPPPLSQRGRQTLKPDRAEEEKTRRSVAPDSLESLRTLLESCKDCGRHLRRGQVIFGEGHPPVRVAFVGDGPGEEEEREGRPLAGKSGELLDRIILAMGLSRDEVYVCNVVKCPSPEGAGPGREDMEACLPFLKRQLALIRPEIICVLGPLAGEMLLGEGFNMAETRGRWRSCLGIPLLVTDHPSFLLEDPARKRQVWEEVKKIMKRLNRIGTKT